MQAPQWKQREVHSMTMELLARPGRSCFFEMTLKKFRVFQLSLPLTLFRMVVW